MKKRVQFDIKKVELESSNLIEASAGTGKTFSIAILVLRLIAEKNIDIKQILMVTFTKAAVAELEGRIREFIREAFRYIQDYDYPTDGLIKATIDKAVDVYTRAEVLDRLKGANINLDETSIFTIHSFCQKTLTEFAFETHQLFGSELLDNQSLIIEKAANEYWRKQITTLSEERLKLLISVGLSKKQLTEVIHKALSGKQFIYKSDIEPNSYFEKILDQSKDLESHIQYFTEQFKNSPERDREHIETGGSYAKKTFLPVKDNSESFLALLIDKQDKKYVEKTFPNLLDKAIKIDDLQKELDEKVKHLLYFYYGQSISIVKSYVEKTKQRLSVMVFDDLIINLHQAVKGAQQDLLKYELQKKYKAVFIDEFQDTDQLQYEIFDTLFGKSSILFYIGDPKQAVYSFRGADIDTYIKAADTTSNAFTMGHNFRSTPRLIEAMNDFFALVDNPFKDSNILYEAVKNGKDFSNLELNGQAEKPLAYMSCDNKTHIVEQCAFHILNLLTQDFKIENKKVMPSDIGVLVRSKKEGHAIKQALNNLNIPSVTIDDAKVLKSDEAQTVFYILKAAFEPSRSNINRALLSPLTAITKHQLLNGNLEQDLIHFKAIHNEWQKNSVLGAISLFIKLYSVKQHLLSQEGENGERIITNLYQIMELLLRKELEDKLLPEELLNRLQNILEGEDVQGDEFSQRIESDEDAVKIVTIHKSKGLSYPIVFAPFLDLQSKPSTQHSFLEYKDQSLDACFSMYKTDEEIELYQQQTEQENRRLIYVALTRAIYKNYIFHNTYHKGGKGSIMPFINAIEPSENFETLKTLDKPSIRYQTPEIVQQKEARIFSGSIKRNWSVLSYSQLSHAHLSFPSETKDEWPTDYDQFVFSELPKGAFAGNFLHDLFENSDFGSTDFKAIIQETSRKYKSIFNPDRMDDYQELIEHVLGSKYGLKGFHLSDIKESKKLPELEFFFDLQQFSSEKIKQMSQLVDIEGHFIDQGMMYGFVDLLFEHEGQYFILDWKSNFLGHSIQDYQGHQLDIAMRGNNYHLQYLIYTVAVKRFLELKLPDFNYDRDFGGVLYVFLRGCRKDETTGIFNTKPEKQLIEQLDQIFLSTTK